MSVEPDTPQHMGSVPYEPPSEPPRMAHGNMDGSRSSTSTSRSGPLLNMVFKMFDVDTSDVINRCTLALNPLLSTPFLTNGMLDSEHGSSPETIVNNKLPDMWGPVWIFLTMVFAVFFAATTSQLLNGVHGQYDPGLLAGTTFTLFSFIFGVPVATWFAIQYFDLVPTLTLLQTICLYGYSCTIWIPAVILAGSPLGAPAIVGPLAAHLVRGIAIFIAFVMSARFVYGNLYKVMSAQASQAVGVNKTRMAIVLVAGTVVHMALAVTVMVLTSFASQKLELGPPHV